jgi:endonuclease/exonuclease/phosphatase family metal-dependent hydrolase
MQTLFITLRLLAIITLSATAQVTANVHTMLSTIAMPDRPLTITTWNLEHMMSEVVFDKWVKACKPFAWDDAAARREGKPLNLTYCDAHSGRDWPCGDRQEALTLRTTAAFDKKVGALRARAIELNSDIYAFQEVSDAEAIARILPPDKYEILYIPDDVAINVGFAIRKELAPAASIRQVKALSVCERRDRTNPVDPSSCIGGSYRTRPGLELSLKAGNLTISLLNVHLKSSCRSHPVSNPPLDKLNARACQSQDFDQAEATAQYRNSVRRGCSLMRDQVPAIEAWVETQANAGNAFMILGDFNRDFGRELRTRIPARLDGADAKAPILPATRIGSLLKEISDDDPPGAYLYQARQKFEGRNRYCHAENGERYRVRTCHHHVDHFLIGKYWAEAVSNNPASLTSTGRDYGDKGYCAVNARPSDHCPLTLKIAVPGPYTDEDSDVVETQTQPITPSDSISDGNSL